MRSTIVRGILAAAAVLTAACSTSDSVAPTTTPASARRAVSGDPTVVANLSRPVDQYIWASCANGGAGEAIHVTGDLHHEVKRFQDSSGVFHLNFKSATYGLTATGLTTGTFYRGLMTERITDRIQDNLNMDVRTADIIRFVAPGSGDGYSLMASTHIVVDQGSYVIWDQTWTEVCR